VCYPAGVRNLQQQRVPPLRALREANGLSLRETARRAEIDPAHLLRAERGEAGLSIDSLQRLARVVGPRQLAEMLQPYAADPDGES
jgi:transcriptional regulator with XRE-family HTH domain